VTVEPVTDGNNIPVAVNAVTGRKKNISVTVETLTDGNNVPVAVDALTGGYNIFLYQWSLLLTEITFLLQCTL
jgi:hypothetical protein